MKRLVVGISVALGCGFGLAGLGCRGGEVLPDAPGPQASMVQACAQGDGVRLAVTVRSYEPKEHLGDYIFRADQKGTWQLDGVTNGRKRWFFDGNQYHSSNSVEPGPVAWDPVEFAAVTDALSLCRSGFAGAVWSPADPWEDGFAKVRPAAVTKWMKFVVPSLAGVTSVPEAYLEFSRSGRPVTVVVKQVDTWIEIKLWEEELAVVDSFPDFEPSYPLGGPSDRGPFGGGCGN